MPHETNSTLRLSEIEERPSRAVVPNPMAADQLVPGREITKCVLEALLQECSRAAVKLSSVDRSAVTKRLGPLRQERLVSMRF